MGILRLVAWGSIPVFQKTEAASGISGPLRSNLQHGRLFIKSKSVKKYCHDAPQVVKVWGTYK